MPVRLRQIPAAVALWLATALPLGADVAAEARAAIDRLAAAEAALQAAEGARDRVAALTETVRAYESGLSALRASLRDAAILEAQLGRTLDLREAEIAQLLGSLQVMARAPEPTLLLHPSGPLATVQATMIMAEVTPALANQAGRLNTHLARATGLRSLREEARDVLLAGLQEAQSARAQLSLAMSDRAALPPAFAEDAARLAALAEASDSLEGLIESLGAAPAPPEAADPRAGGDAGTGAGPWPLPVNGVVLLGPGEADASGIRRPGITIATRPHALVSLPFLASLRYVGPFLDYGQVAIVEPAAGRIVILAGLGQSFGRAGDVIAAGTPLGLMGARGVAAEAGLGDAVPETTTDLTQSLYIEVREENVPVDPGTWFLTDKEG